jgi:hypothetical protein
MYIHIRTHRIRINVKHVRAHYLRHGAHSTIIKYRSDFDFDSHINGDIIDHVTDWLDGDDIANLALTSWNVREILTELYTRKRKPKRKRVQFAIPPYGDFFNDMTVVVN